MYSVDGAMQSHSDI